MEMTKNTDSLGSFVWWIFEKFFIKGILFEGRICGFMGMIKRKEELNGG